jgi:AraC family transcriptional regulator
LAKIAAWEPKQSRDEWSALDRAIARRRETGSPGRTLPRAIAAGEGWRVADVICTCGPDDRSYEERHTDFAIAVVVTGSFQCRSPLGRAVMMPGSLMLGNAGQCFECGHEQGEGDRCVSFWLAPDYFDQLAADAGLRRTSRRFATARIPPLRPLSLLVTRAAIGAAHAGLTAWEEVGVSLAAAALRLSSTLPAHSWRVPPNAERRVIEAVGRINRHPAEPWTLGSLARTARLSPYHFLRTFDRLTGVTPHQYVMRTRLRHATMRLIREPGRVLDVALDCGFGDVSNFNRAFRTEFGVNPRRFRHFSSRPGGCPARRP